MAALGVPTSRALAAVATGDNVIREGMVPGGVFTRVAQSHIRIGTFEWFSSRKDHDNLRVLADYVIARHYPAAAKADNPYRAMLEGIIERQSNLIPHWMQLGFIHGVMNTDNMTVSGETIDYGPCAFLDDYDPAKTFSSIDHQGRYAFSNQGPIAHWNLTRLAEAVLPLLDDDLDKSIAIAEATLAAYSDLHQSALNRRFLAKIGIQEPVSPEVDGADWSLVERLLAAMTEGKADFTLVFRHLSDALESGNDETVVDLFDKSEAIVPWLGDFRGRFVGADRMRALTVMRQANPVFIPRNHRIEEAIVAGNKGDFEPFHRLNQVLQQPFTVQPEFSEYESAPLPKEVVQKTFCGT